MSDYKVMNRSLVRCREITDLKTQALHLPVAVVHMGRVETLSNLAAPTILEVTGLFAHKEHAEQFINMLSERDIRFNQLSYKGTFRYKAGYIPGDIVRHENGPVEGLWLCVRKTTDFAPDQPVHKGETSPWIWLPRMYMPKDRAQQHVRDLSGRVLTLIDALITDKTQLTAFKSIIKKEFREELNRIAEFYREDGSAVGVESSEEIVTDSI